jgi:hypothetical protein
LPKLVGYYVQTVQRSKPKQNKMNIYGLKELINAMEKQNNPNDRYMLEFYKDLYNEQLQQIADKVQKELDEQTKKSWFEHLAR